jgi:hypothetical protein
VLKLFHVNLCILEISFYRCYDLLGLFNEAGSDTLGGERSLLRFRRGGCRIGQNFCCLVHLLGLTLDFRNGGWGPIAC